MSCQASTAHPRSRGENRHSPASTLQAWGSSPLTRGKQLAASIEEATGRLIPAHAGKTGCCPVPARLGTAHPRSRGENPLGTLRAFRLRGSSPLTRGKP